MPVRLLFVVLFVMALPRMATGQWVAQPSNSTFTVNDIHFTAENVGFIGTSNSIFKTVNGGATWSGPQYPGGTVDFELLSSSYIHDIHFFNPSNGLMTGSGFFNGFDIVARTTDGGASWRLVYSEIGQGDITRIPLMSMTFLDDNTGFIVGGGGKILKTADGGNSWQNVTSPTTHTLRKIVFVDNSTGFIAGEKVMLKTTNGGTTWTVTPSNYTLYDLHFFNASTGIATTLEGFILKTVDGGASWSEYPVNFNAMLGKMAFEGQTGYVVAFDGFYHKSILKTTDGGSLWEQQFPDAMYHLAGITIAPGGRAWAGGLYGKIFATSNGGGPAYPIASFKASSTVFCQGLNYSFTNNGPQNVYTYEWRVDGVLKATSYNFQATFTPGNHVIELTAINGQLKGTSQLAVSVDAGIEFSKPSFNITFDNGLCKGGSTVITVKDPEEGSYKLYRGNELLAEDNYTYDGIVLRTPALQSSTAIRVTATRTNRCETRELQRDTTITVYENILQNSSIQAVQNYFCNSGAPAVQITSTRNYLKYDLFSNTNLVGSVVGNGQTRTITSPVISDTTKFTVKVSAINGTCVKSFDDTVKINVEKVKADFYLSSMNAGVAEPVNVYNKSEGATNFQWSFGGASPSTSIAQHPVPIQFQQMGTSPVTLTVSSASGCSNSITRSMYAYDDTFLKSSCWAIGTGVNPFATGSENQLHIPDIDVAPGGDIVMAGSLSIQAEFDSKAGVDKKITDEDYMTNYLAKYSSRGVLKWAFTISRYAAENTKVLVSNDGSIYVLTSYGGPPIFYSANGDTFEPYTLGDYASRQYILKYNADGMLQWVKAKWEIDSNPNQIMSMDIDAAGNLYVMTDTFYKLSPNGEILSGKKVLDSPMYPYEASFKVCPDGSWYFAYRSNYNTRLRKYSSSSDLLWENSIIATNFGNSFESIALAPDNGLVLTGSGYNGGLLHFESKGENEHVVDVKSFFMVKYDVSGKISWINSSLSDGQVMSGGLAINETGEIAFSLRLLGNEVSVKSQDGNNFVVADINEYYLVTYDANGNYVRKDKIFDEGNPGCYITNIVSKENQTYVTGQAFNTNWNGLPTGPVPVINGDLVHSSFEWTSFLAKFESTCAMTPGSSFTADVVEPIVPELPICPGSVFHVTYEVTPGTYIGQENIFTVYLDAMNGGSAIRVGSLASSFIQGTIEVTIPNDIPSGYTYNIRVWASQPKLYSGILAEKVAIAPVSQPDFTYSSNQDLVFDFSPSGYAQTVACRWTMDGKTINEQSHTYKFPEAGLFEVCLMVVDECGLERMACKNINVTCAPVPTDFTYTVNDKTVTFTGTTNPSNTLHWNFGDGSSAATLHAVHTFANYGEKYVCFESSTECNKGTACKLITLTCIQGTLNFGFTPTEKNVQFTNSSAVEFTQFEWNFGDGTYSAEENPQHAYAEPGTYSVTLLSTGKCGVLKTITQDVTITCLQPTADFQSTANGMTHTFNNLSLNATEQTWTFGDGTFSNAISPQHTFALPGNYSVCLTTQNNCTQKTICKIVTVSFPIPTAPSNLIATALSRSSIGLQWNDNSSNEESFTIWYKETGASVFQLLATRSVNNTQYTADNLVCNKSYTFKVIAVGQGNSEAASNEATVMTMKLDKPVVTPGSVDRCVGEAVTFEAAAGFSHYLWSNGATTQKITVTVGGSYAVKVTDNNNCESEFSNASTVNFNPAPITTIEIVNTKLKAVTVADQYQWYLGDVLIPGATNREFVPDVSGFYKVKLVENGCPGFSSPIEFIVTGVKENINSEVELYPMPANDKLIIDFSNASFAQSSGSISFFNATGNLSLQARKLADEKIIELSVSKLTPGLYVLVIDMGRKVVYRKITIQ